MLQQEDFDYGSENENSHPEAEPETSSIRKRSPAFSYFNALAQEINKNISQERTDQRNQFFCPLLVCLTAYIST